MLVFALLLHAVAAPALALEPQIPSIGAFEPGDTRAPFVFTPRTRIVVGSDSADLLAYARTFRADLQEVSGWAQLAPVQVQLGSSGAARNTVHFSLDATARFAYRSGVATGEGYEFAVSSAAYAIRAREPIGVWWGTRTLLQQFVLARAAAAAGNSSAVAVSAGSGTDVPGWEVRGAMLDVGRHYFTTGFLTELCAYASFWKLNTLHLHASDNLWDPRFLYGPDWRKLYTGFRFRPSPGSPNAGLVPPDARNETWSKQDFRAMQAGCAARGVSLVPEIDAPGHSLVFSKWKPQLAMAGAPDNLNLSHPDTLATLQAVWNEFLPWFSGAEVHVGADEYDRAYAAVYNAYVNSMADFVRAQSGGTKRVRVWGTGMPPVAGSRISTDVTIQHWNFPDTVPVRLLAQGYSVINSEQAFLYTDGKTSYMNAQFPRSLDADLLRRARWQPNVFTAAAEDAENNTTPDHPRLRGAVMALWNDWGNNATTPNEIFRQLAPSLALLAERCWAGADAALARAEFERVFPALAAAAPGQDLARRHIRSRGSLGPPYTLRFTVVPHARGGVLFAGPDSRLHLDGLAFEDVATGVVYPLQNLPPLPLHRPTRVEVRATADATWVTVDGVVYFYETLLDIWGEYMQPANMSFVAPTALAVGVAGGFRGVISDVRLTPEVD